MDLFECERRVRGHYARSALERLANGDSADCFLRFFQTVFRGGLKSVPCIELIRKLNETCVGPHDNWSNIGDDAISALKTLTRATCFLMDTEGTLALHYLHERLGGALVLEEPTANAALSERAEILASIPATACFVPDAPVPAPETEERSALEPNRNSDVEAVMSSILSEATEFENQPLEINWF